MKKFLAAAAVATAFIASSAQAGITVTTEDGTNPYSAYGGQTTFDFDSATPATNCPQCIVSGTSSGNYAQPYGSTGNYFSVGPSTGQPGIIDLGVTGIYYMSMIWGSVDTYNAVTFLDENMNTLGTITGAQVAAPANGDQGDPQTNPVVTFHFSGAEAAAVRYMSLRSDFGVDAPGQNAFEIDNIRVHGVPEPMTWAMMIMGFGMIGGVMRRRSATTVRYA